MWDGDDFLVVVNGGLSPFNVALRQSCRLQSKRRLITAEESAVCRRRAYRLPWRAYRLPWRAYRMPWRAYRLSHPARRPPSSCASLPHTSTDAMDGRPSTLRLSVVFSITTSLTFPLLILNFSGEYTILPTYSKSYFPRGWLTRALRLTSGRPRWATRPFCVHSTSPWTALLWDRLASPGRTMPEGSPNAPPTKLCELTRHRHNCQRGLARLAPFSRPNGMTWKWTNHGEHKSRFSPDILVS